MTEKANPSFQRNADSFKTAGAIALAGGSNSGWVSPAASPSDIAVQDADITHGNLNAFAQTSSASSFDVTIDPGEAFVYGAWLAIDTSTTVTLSSSTAAQTVYVGWNKDGTDDVIVGLASAFASASGDSDEKIPLFDFDTDGSGVTAVTDRREIDYHQDATTFRGTVDLSSNSIIDVSDINVGTTNIGRRMGAEFSGNEDGMRLRNTETDSFDWLVNGSSPALGSAGSAIVYNGATGRRSIEYLNNDDILIPNGNLDLSGNKLYFNGSGKRFETYAGGAQYIDVNAGNELQFKLGGTTSSSILLKLIDGGSVEIPNTGLIVSDVNLGTNGKVLIGNDTNGEIELGDSTKSAGTDQPFIDFHYSIGASEDFNFRIQNDGDGQLTMSGDYLDLANLDRMQLPSVTSDPAASAGDIWYRSDLD